MYAYYYNAMIHFVNLDLLAQCLSPKCILSVLFNAVFVGFTLPFSSHQSIKGVSSPCSSPLFKDNLVLAMTSSKLSRTICETTDAACNDKRQQQQQPLTPSVHLMTTRIPLLFQTPTTKPLWLLRQIFLGCRGQTSAPATTTTTDRPDGERLRTLLIHSISLARFVYSLSTSRVCFVKRLCSSNADGDNNCPRQQQQARLETRGQLRKQARIFRILLCLQLSCSPIINMRLSSYFGHVVFSFFQTAASATRGGPAASKKIQQQFRPWGNSPKKTEFCTLPRHNNQTQCHLSMTVNNTRLVSTAAARTSVVSRRLPSPW